MKLRQPVDVETGSRHARHDGNCMTSSRTSYAGTTGAYDMDKCSEIANPYLACSDRLQQFRKFEIEEYRVVIRQLQTATAQWYLSILKDHECFSDLEEDIALEPGANACDTVTTSDRKSSLGGQDTLHLHAKNSRDASSRGHSLRSGSVSLPAEPLIPTHAGELSPNAGQSRSPLCPSQEHRQRHQQPSLLDLCPSVFGAAFPDRHDRSDNPAMNEFDPGMDNDCSKTHTQPPLSKPPCCAGSLAKSWASLCPSIQHLLDGAEDTPLEPFDSDTSPSNGPYSSAAPQPKTDAHAPQSMLDLQPSVIGCFDSSSSDSSSLAPDADMVDAETSSGVSGYQRSTIPAFHQGPDPHTVSEPSLATAGDSGARAVTVFCHDIATLRPHEAEMISSMGADTLCLNHLSRASEFGIQSQPSSLTSSSGCHGWPGTIASLTRSESMLASMPQHSTAGIREGSDEDSLAPLRHAKSLMPTRRSMLTPAADCNGGQLLPEVPALQTYKNARPARPRRAHFKSSVMIMDSPTIHMYEEDAATASMTVSGVSHPQEDGVQHRRRQHNRRRGSYMSVRSGLFFVDHRKHDGLHLSTLREARMSLGGHPSGCEAIKTEPFACPDQSACEQSVQVSGEKPDLMKMLGSLSSSQAVPVTQVSCEKHGGLTASLEVLCQALTDSRHLAVCLELGLKLSNPPTWIEILSLILRSLEAPARGAPSRGFNHCDVAEVCHQVALVFFPIGLALTAMQRNLMTYVESAGCHAPRRRQPNQHVPACPPLGSPAGSVYTSAHLADAWNASGADLAVTEFEGRPQEYLTPLLPRVMFDYISSLVSIGMRIDAVEGSHGIDCSKALNIIKSQVSMTLDGLSMLTSTLVHSLMGVCQGNIASADIRGLLSSLSPFLGASLEHMAASVSLINGRLPLNTTDEALEVLARTEHTWYQQRSASTAFFHCLSVCGHMLTILEGLERDLNAWQKAEADSPPTQLLPAAETSTNPMSLYASLPCVSSMHSPSNDAATQLGYEWQVLFDVLPKVQATSSRLVMLVGSLIQSASRQADGGRHTPSTRSMSHSLFGNSHSCAHVSHEPCTAGLSPSHLQPPLASSTSKSVSPLRMALSGRTQPSAQPDSQPSLLLSIPSVAGEPPALGSQKLSCRPSSTAAPPDLGPVSPGAITPPPPFSMAASVSHTARRLFSPRSCLPCFSGDLHEADAAEPECPWATPPAAAPRLAPGMPDGKHSLTAPPGLPRLQVGDSLGGGGDAVLASPQVSAFTACAPPFSPVQSGTPGRMLSSLRSRSSTTRSFLRNMRSPSLAIEEPQHGFGALSSDEHPMSPIARQMMLMRIRSETRPPFSAASRATDDLQVPEASSSDGVGAGTLETPRPSHRREGTSHSASAMVQPHGNGGMSKSMMLTSLARALGSDSPSRMPSKNQLCNVSAALSTHGADFPKCLTLQEVARVQAALARGVVSLGIVLVQLLRQRCMMVRAVTPDSMGADEEAAVQRQRTSEVLARCQVTAQAQLSLSHNMKRWTTVLLGSTELAEDMDAAEQGGLTGSLYGALDTAVQELQEVVVAQQHSVGVSATKQQLGQGQLVELLLGSGIKPLGKKSLGSVWMHHLGWELVAVKWITIEDDPMGRGYTAAQKQSMLIREVEAMMRLQHPAIVRLLGITTMVTPLALAAGSASCGHAGPQVGRWSGSNDGSGRVGVGNMGAGEPQLPQATVGIVLELCMYGTLQDFLNQTRALFNNSSRIRAGPEGGLVLRQGACTSALEAMCLCFINSWSQRLRLCREIASALAACHAAGVLHRDLTSFNVMLSDMLEVQPGAQECALSWRETNDDGEVEDVWSLPWATRLIDFGLSKHSRDQPLDAHSSIDVHSIPWMAPEMFISMQHLKASDVYGLGMVIWEVLSTHKPPTSNMQTFIATGLAFSGATSNSPGPCETELSQLLQMHESGNTAVLMRKLHGVLCPVLPELVDLIRDTQRYRPQDRITAAEVARRLAKLETACAAVPPGMVPREDQELARYWRETGEAEEESELDLVPFSSTSSMVEGDENPPPWLQYVAEQT
eukprot:jgi/Ulvmu1/12732/UM095_0037.1